MVEREKMNTKESQILLERAQKIIPGGVNSPVRACLSVGTKPVFIKQGEGCWLIDADGNRFIDYIGSWGPLILGHCHPFVMEAINKAVKRGSSFGAPTELEIELAEMVIDAVPSIEMIRMVNSGTEATMSAIRLARGFTGRDIIIKFDGCYHGHADSLLVEAGSGIATLGIPGSPGVPSSFVAHTISLPYNDLDHISKIMAEKGDKVACIIVEPVAGNMGLVLPKDGFLTTLRELSEKSGTVLIFDEVMSGFRVAYGGAQDLFGVRPDLTCFGKIIGGGLPVGAYGGQRKIMEQIAPGGPVYQAGTLSGNPLAMAAGIATLTKLKENGFYQKLDKIAEELATGLKQAALEASIKAVVSRVGSMMGLFFTDQAVYNFADAKMSDLAMFAKYYQGMLKRGIYIAPSQFEALFVSSAHDSAAIEQTIAAAKETMRNLKGEI